MDPITQGLLGAAVGQLAYGRALGRRALGWGALVGMAPDLDVLMNGTSPLAEWLWHRGPTHALWFGPVVGTGLGWLLWRLHRRGHESAAAPARPASPGGVAEAGRAGGAAARREAGAVSPQETRPPEGRLRDWIGLAVLALFTHPLLDVFTTYGTQLFAPFSRQRFAWDGVAIVDPLYSLVLAAALVFGLRRGAASRAARICAAWALALSTGYLLLGVWVNARVETLARRQLAAEGIPDAQVAAYPTLLQLPFRRVVARHGDEVRVGWLSLLAPSPIEWQRFTAASGPAVEAARATEAVRVLEWFAMGETAARLDATPDGGAVVEIDDLRYGLPGDARNGLWGVRVRLDSQRRLVGGPERIDRPLPAPASDLLGQIMRQTLGSS
jgi:inner membrane protein